MRNVVSMVLVIALGVAGCNDGSSGSSGASGAVSQIDIGEVLATVNGEPVGSKEFQERAGRKQPGADGQIDLEARKEVLDQMISDEVLYQEALRLGLDKDPKVKKVMVNTLLREQVYAKLSNDDISDADLEAYYNEHKDEFVVPEKVQIKRILIRVTPDRPDEEARVEAERIRRELSGNLDAFKDFAAKYSEDPYKRRGGDVGFVSSEGKPGLDQEIVDKAFALPVDSLSEVFRSNDGYNIILVPNRRERVERTFQQMKGSVLRKLKNDRLRDMYDGYVAGLRTGAQIAIQEEKLAGLEVTLPSRPAMQPGMQLGPGMARPSMPPHADDDLSLGVGEEDEADEGGHE